MLLKEKTLQKALAEALGIPLTLAITQSALDETMLFEQEYRLFMPVSKTPRRLSWLRGRAALRQVLMQLEESLDTATITFPHPRFSITHSTDYAVAIGTPANTLRGIGVDFEMNRITKTEAARFFLVSHELDWFKALPEEAKQAQLLRLWTVKEAIFKADPDNTGKGLRDYRLHEPALHKGWAFRQDMPTLKVQYCTLETDKGFFSVAITPGRNNHDR